jgi:hypothetical protein
MITVRWLMYLILNSDSCSIIIVRNQANGPKNKHMFHTFVMWFIFNLQRRKMWKAQKTHLEHTQRIVNTCVSIKAKIKKALLGWKSFVQGCQLPSTPVPCCELTAPFPQTLLALTHPPDISLNPISTHVIRLSGRRRHWQTGILYPEQLL